MNFLILATHSEAEIAEIASTSRALHHSKMVGVDPYVIIEFPKTTLSDGLGDSGPTSNSTKAS